MKGTFRSLNGFNYRMWATGAIVSNVGTWMQRTVQLSIEPVMRGRVMAILLAIALGGTPIGAPIVGWVADTFGPRWALGAGAASGFAAAIVGIYYLTQYGHLRVRIDAGCLRFRFDEHNPMTSVTLSEQHLDSTH